MASRGTRSSIRWENVQHGYSTTSLTSGRYQLLSIEGETWTPNDDASLPVVGAYTRLRHLKGLVTLSTAGTEIWVGTLVMWKGNKILDPGEGSEVPASAQEIFFRQPIAIVGDMVQRYTFSWPKVSVDQGQRFAVMLISHTTSGSTTLGYSYQYKMQTRLQ